ncbi:MAG: TetR/AcrR family transcriptional regulator [Methanomicrobiales archaeon]|nr:TetR/AcrR family transcriptional regulator [Methanomicrobiales archaeon]
MPRINSDYRKEAKKKIINAGLEVASTEGWTGVTLDAIAKKVGVTKGAFYSYYASSNLLMQDVVIEMIRTIRNQMFKRITKEMEIDAVLESLAEFIFNKSKPILLAFVQAMASGLPKEEAFQEKLSGIIDENHEFFLNILTQYQKKGQIKKEVDLSGAVLAIYGMSIGLGMMTHVLGKDSSQIKQIWLDSVKKILLLDE